MTRVLLLKNLVAAADVDAGLGREVKAECEKWGPVDAVEVDVAPDQPEDEAVRLFLRFDTKKSAAMAFLDMEGRYFAGRRISATFYQEARFERKDLAPGDDPP